jgi:serine/threonine protein phosphatase PrpC
MGVYLSTPDTRKVTVSGAGNGFKFAATAMQGWRLNMEDAEISKAEFQPGMSLFAVFDGHGGSEVAKFCGQHFGPELLKTAEFKAGDYKNALIKTFLQMDIMVGKEEFKAELNSYKTESGEGESDAGCTANVCLIVKRTVYCANAGDSRTVLWTTGKSVHTALSKDHKPDDTLEKDRIAKAGGFVIEGRVNGNLNLSRALGDLGYKKNTNLKPEAQLISGYPDIHVQELKPEDHFLVMGCDGIWELNDNNAVCKIVLEKLNSGASLKDCAEEVLDRGLAPDTSQGSGCDNMSAIVITLRD